MEKKLENYLHLYLGCQIVRVDALNEPIILNEDVLHNIAENNSYFGYHDSTYKYKPILRQLSSMTEEEAEEWKKISFNDDFKLKPLYTDNDYNSFRYLLSKHFDLFQLIESGLAIEAEKVKLSDTTQTSKG